ncbi:MAG: EAL domain-containing protein [Rubrivivax sp.]|jgi:diguanylate cyclase (GGDEF)-like protein|nr:EAL domain-containing protein [Rubrivivax sp.]
MRVPALSIRATVLLAIVVGMLIPALVVIAIDRHGARKAHEPVVAANRSAVQVLAAAVVTEPAWTLSEPGLRAAVDRILREPSVCAVELLGLQPDSTENSATVPGALAGRKCAPDHPVTVAETPVLHEGQSIARLRIEFDDTEIERVLGERLLTTALLVAAQVVFGVLVLAGVLSVRLLRPIDRLKQQAGTLSSRDAVVDERWTRRDELGQLGQHLNEARRRLRELIGELEAKNEQLHRLAMYDHLTHLPNRALLAELFGHEAAAARRAGRQLALMFIDLDRFKNVNDTHGHAAGDELLLETSRRLKVALRESDIVCRLGGDEFVVLLPHVEGWDQVAATAQRLLEVVGRPVALRGAGASGQVSASIGIAMYPHDGEDFDALARAADLAMYRSKDLGRARFSFYQPELDAALRDRLELERQLAAAIERGELVLHYQPVVEASAGTVVGAEALVRWQHPERGLLAPAAFVPIAEETGLIRELGLWVMHEACAQLAAWRGRGLEIGHVAVNVSAAQLHDALFAEAVRSAMRDHGLAPGQLEIELTESVLLGDEDVVMRQLARLREAGATIAIDDFGTAYSALRYLKRVRPDTVKIDRDFVDGLPDDADDRNIVGAVRGMADAFGIAVVAEGVETAAQRDWLCAAGCTRQQGWLHGKPMPAAAFAACLARDPAPAI